MTTSLSPTVSDKNIHRKNGHKGIPKVDAEKDCQGALKSHPEEGRRRLGTEHRASRLFTWLTMQQIYLNYVLFMER